MASDDPPIGADDHRAPRPATVLERLISAGLDPDRSRAWLRDGLVRVDGVHVTDPDTAAAPPARIVLNAG